MLLLLVLAATPLETSHVRLAAALARELERREVLVGADSEAVWVRLTEVGHARIDAVWKVLGAVAREARTPGAAPLRVDTAAPSVPECLRREQGAADYLFRKQQVSPARVTVAPCAVSSEARAGPLFVEAPRFTLGDHAPLGGVSVRARNDSAAPVTLELTRLELLPEPREVAVRGLWFRVEGVSEPPFVRVREDGKGPLTVSVPPGVTVEVMLEFAPFRGPLVRSRRVSFKVGTEAGVVAGQVARVGFSPDFVEGTP